MSTSTCWIVVPDVAPDNVRAVADVGIHWLIEQGVVVPTPPTPTEIFPADSPLYPRHLLAPGARALEWSEPGAVFSVFSGLSVVTEKQVFDPGENAEGHIVCPHCSAALDDSELDWMPAIGAWWAGEPDALTCPRCGASTRLPDWIFPGAGWAFGYLGFGFENWDIDARLLPAIEALLGLRCVLVRNRL